MATPFKLKSGNASAFKNLGASPAKQMPENWNKGVTPGYSTTKAAKIEVPNLTKEALNDPKIKTKSNTKGFDKWMKNVGKAGSRALGVLGFMGAGTLSATAGDVSEKSEGEQIKNLLTKHKLKGGKN